jgi:uridine kinase
MGSDEIVAKVLTATEALPSYGKSRLILAIDGRCASGKTTLAIALQKKLNCSLIHMDHFYLQPHQRTVERLERPGGNVDMERFSVEALDYILESKAFSYQPFDCKKQNFGETIHIPESDIYIIEGVYSCLFAEHFCLKVFMSVSEQEQFSRLEKRNPAMVDKFRQEWIPMEEKYFDFFNVEELCDLVFRTG